MLERWSSVVVVVLVMMTGIHRSTPYNGVDNHGTRVLLQIHGCCG